MSVEPSRTDLEAAPRTLAIGDIHGCDTALRTLLNQVQPRAIDTVVLLGDAVNRGPNSRDVLDQLVDLSKKSRLIYIFGNHEEVMVAALLGQAGGLPNFKEMGGRKTLDSYHGSLDHVPDEHRELIASAFDFWETDREIFVHANLEPDVSLEQQKPLWLRWMHQKGAPLPHPSGKRIIYGHTPQRSGLPRVIPGWIGIDTWA
ncbi:MAG: metallophosphoesterase family protein, partial [Planctomycetota bacterium]|nr:metallophosphoesterase family protein [Planctomycetota bacterium]